MTITPATIAVALGRTAPAQDSAMWAQWEMWIGDAQILINSRKIDLGITYIDDAKLEYVIREAVVAQVRRPDDATQVTVTVDDATTSKTYQSSRGRVEILDEWWKLLGLTSPDGGAFSIDTVGCRAVHLPWCSLNFGATYCSCGTDIAGHPIFEGGWC
jgi:hypothetical protein